jgi:hypothetical protein
MNNDDYGHLEPPITANYSFSGQRPNQIENLAHLKCSLNQSLGTDGVCSLMSAEGQKQTSRAAISMSALLPKADIAEHN